MPTATPAFIEQRVLAFALGHPGEQHHCSPAFLAPQLGFGAGRFGAQFVDLLAGVVPQLGWAHRASSSCFEWSDTRTGAR
jgi:hypothetical protein